MPSLHRAAATEYTVTRVYFTAVLLVLLIKTVIIFNMAHPSSVLQLSCVVSDRRLLLTRNSRVRGGIDFSVWQAVSDVGIAGGSCG
jgi:hypothetical protein